MQIFIKEMNLNFSKNFDLIKPHCTVADKASAGENAIEARKSHP